MAGNNTLTFNSLNFDSEVLNSDKPVLVDFTATWCGPCKAVAPIVDKLGGKYAGIAKVGKLDIDNSPDIAAKFGIRGVPTLLVFKGGEIVGQQVGAAPETILDKLISENL
jgi:thioredoxin 1